MKWTAVDVLKAILSEHKETNRLLRDLADRHDHRWMGPDMEGPMRCRVCGEFY